MKVRWIAAASALAACLSFGETARADDAAAIADVIRAAARAMSELPETRNRKAVLDLYAADYTGVTDGEWQTREAIDAVVEEIDENVKAGNPVTIANRASEIEAHPGERYGWATWLSYSRIEVLGEVLGEVERRCTGIFRRNQKTWLIRHEHCSAPWNAPQPANESPAEEPVEPGAEDPAVFSPGGPVEG